jgi:hypothetical protein
VRREVANWQKLQVTHQTVVVYEGNDVKGYCPRAKLNPAH